LRANRRGGRDTTMRNRGGGDEKRREPIEKVINVGSEHTHTHTDA